VAIDATTRPTVAVIVPVFNRLALLRQTVAALRAQTLDTAEFLMVDDRSDADVWGYLESLPHSDPRFRAVRKPENLPRGCQVSRNLGLDDSSAESVMFLDSDDLISPTCLEQRYAVLAAHPDVDIVIGRQAIFSESQGSVHWVNVPKPERDDLDRFLDLTHPIDVPWVNGAALIRKRSLDARGIRYRHEFEWEDVAFHFECLISGLRVARMPFPGTIDCFYRVHSDVRMGSDLFTAAGMRSAAAMIKWMCTRLQTAGQWTESRRRALVSTLFQTCILRAIDNDNFDLARELTLACADGLPLSDGDVRSITAYRLGRSAFRHTPRVRYYWDRFTRRFLMPDKFPSGQSTYGTIPPDSPEYYSDLRHLLRTTA
jgi:hypothetical protein